MPRLTSTHTYALLELSPAAYDEIAGKLRAAGYHHAFNDGVIDMHGIGIASEKAKPVTAPRLCVTCRKPEGEPHPYRHIPRYEEVV